VADFAKDKAIIDLLAGVGKPKATTNKLRTSVGLKPTDGLLASLDAAAKRQKSGVAPIATSPNFISSSDIKNIASTSGSILGPLLAPTVDLLDVGKRAVISTIREAVDTVDFKADTKASFSDWKNQVNDREFGYGKAFPISGDTFLGRWGGRSVGLIGDLIFDPLNWATLGGAIPAKALIRMSAKEFAEATASGAAKKYVIKKVLQDGSVDVAARSALGKHVIGRDGRAALAKFTKQRLLSLRNEGVPAYKNLSNDSITSISGKVYADGKSALFKDPKIPAGFAESIGVRPPGIYYFGSRFKVPGTTGIGRLSEDAITDLRLFLSRTKVGKAARLASTGKGVGRLMRFGTAETDESGQTVIKNAVKEARVNLADGSLVTPKQIEQATIVLEGHDIGRFRNAVYVEDESVNFVPLVDELAAVESGHKYLDMIPRKDLEGMVPYDPDAAIALKVRDFIDSLWQKVNTRSAELGGKPIPYREGYFTHLETPRAKQMRLKMGDEAFDDMISPLTKAERLATSAERRSVFHERSLKAGDDFFGVKLIDYGPDGNMDVDSLNRIFRQKGGFDFDLFENKVAPVLAEYLHQYADQMAWFDTLEYITKNYPEYLGFGETLAQVSGAYQKEVLNDAPIRAFNNLQEAIRNHSVFMEDSLDSVRSELVQKFNSLEAMMRAIEDGTISQSTLDDLHRSLVEQINIADDLERGYKEMLAVLSSSIENRDGVGGFSLFFKNSEALSTKFQELKNLAMKVEGASASEKPSLVKELFDKYEQYNELVGTFSRNLDFASNVSDVFPGLTDIGNYGASQQHDIFAKIIDAMQGASPASAARLRSQGFGPKNATRFGWTKDGVEAVARLTVADAREVLGSVRSGTLAGSSPAFDNKLRTVANYVKSMMVENELLGGSEVSTFLRDEKSGLRYTRIRKNAQSLLKSPESAPSKQTLYGQWLDAYTALKAGDATLMEDILIQQQSLSKIYNWQEMFAPFGIQIGDDVVDEIVQREARDFALDALRRNDAKRFEKLTSNSFGRQDGTGPLGTHRLIERERQNLQYAMGDQLDAEGLARKAGKRLETTKRTPEQVRERNNQLFIRKMSKEQRNMWARVRAENTKLIEYAEGRIKNLIDSRIKPNPSVVSEEIVWNTAEKRFDEVVRFIESGELFGIANDASTDTFVLYDDLINYLHDVARQNPLMSDNWPAFLESAKKEIDRVKLFHQRTNPTSKVYSDQKFSLRETITNALLGELENSKVIYLSRLRSYEDAVNAEIIRLTKLQKQAADTLNNPREYFERGAGRAELVARDNAMQAMPRGLDEGGLVVDARTGELIAPTKRELDIKIAEYRNSEQYPIARSVENNANYAYILSYLNLDKIPTDYMPGGIRFTSEEWDKFVNGQLIETSSGKFQTFMTALRRDKDMYLEASYLEDSVSDAKLLEGFVDFVVANFRDTDAVVLSDEVINFRRKTIDRALKRSEHYSWLEEYRTLEQRKFAQAYAENAADEVRQLDLLTNTVDSIREMSATQVAQTAEWGPSARARLTEAVDDLLKGRGNVRKVNKAESKLAYDADGVQQSTFVGRLGEGKEVADIEALPIRGIDEVDVTVLAKNKRAGDAVDLYLMAPNAEKAVEQLQQEIDILKRLDAAKVDTPYTSGKSRKRLILEREKEISKRLDNVDPTMSQREVGLLGDRVPDNYSSTVAEALAEDARRTASRKTADSVMGNRPKGEFDPDAQEIIDLEKLRESVTPAPREGVDMVAVPRDTAPASTVVDPKRLGSLEKQLDELNAIPREKAREASEKARQVANRMRDTYDQAAAVRRIDPQVVTDTKNQLDQLRQLIEQSEIKTNPKLNKRTATQQRKDITFRYSQQNSELFNRHQEARAFLEYANEVMLILGMKKDGEFDLLDSVLRSQVASEAEVHRALLGMTSMQEERAMLRGVQEMIDSGGGRLLADGRVRMPDGTVRSGVPESAVYKAGKEVRENFATFSEYFPELYGSPEMIELLKNASRFEDPLFVRKMAYYIGPYTKVFKAFAVLSPGFHVRNGLANAIQLALAGTEMDNAIQGSKLYYSWMKAKKAGNTWDEFVGAMDPRIRDVMNVAREGSIGSGGGIFSDVIKESIGGRLEKLWLIRKNYALGQASDNYSRFILAYDSAMRGNDAATAAARVKRFFFDYEDLSTVDTVMKQIIPFWIFYSRNLNVQITNMWLNPRPYLIYENVKDNIQDDETPLPPFVRQMGGFRLPVGKGIYAMPDFGFTRVPQEMEDLTNPMRMLNKVNPVFSVPLEQIMGKDVYTEKEFDGTQDRLLNALRGIAPPAQQFDKLVTNDNPMSQLNAWLSYMGSPIRKYN
jgi:hypothetical protein